MAEHLALGAEEDGPRALAAQDILEAIESDEGGGRGLARRTRRRALELAEELGLERVDPPFGAAAGELWIRTDPSIDSELEHWS